MIEPTTVSSTITTEIFDGASAAYSFEGRVVRVHGVWWTDGRSVSFVPPVDLGVALSEMPRRLWQQLHSMSGSGSRSSRR